MSTATKVALAEYLSTTYRPDCDYIDGHVVERNAGDSDHSDIQGELLVFLRTRREKWNIWAGPELRVIVSPRRVRIPDVTVVVGSKPKERFLTEPPLLCIEVLSQGDSLHSIQDRIDDYTAMGVPHVWVIDPYNKQAWTSDKGALVPVRDGVLRTMKPEIAVPLRELSVG